MELTKANEIIERLEEQGYEAGLYREYSGRAMYGKTTYAVTTDCSPVTMEAHRIEYPCVDNMGLEYVYY